MHPAGVGGTSASRAPQREATGVDRVEAVDVLRRVDSLDGSLRVDACGKRKLNEDAVDTRVRVQVIEESTEIGGRRRRRLVMELAADADLA